MSIEDMTQEEWDEHHEQLGKYLDGVEKRHIARLGVAMGFSREWVGLTDEEILLINGDEHHSIIAAPDAELIEFARAIEAKLKEKNT